MCFNIEYSCHTITNIIHGRRLSLQLRPPTVFMLQKPQKYDFFFIVDICLLTFLEHNPKISNPMVISKVV